MWNILHNFLYPGFVFYFSIPMAQALILWFLNMIIMKKIIQCYFLVFFAVIVLMACGGGSDPVKEAKKENRENIDSLQEKHKRDSAALAVMPSKDDADFMVNAASGATLEVELGKLSLTNARNQRVKDFGAMMVKDHSEGVKKLKELAVSKGITLTDSVSKQQQKEKTRLQKMKGADFDDAYMNLMADDHKKDINEFERQADNGTNAAIRAFAGDNLSMLRRHLDSAVNILKVVAKKTPSVPVAPPY